MAVRDQVSIDELRGVDVFTGLADHELEQIARVCRRRTYQAGERCVVQGENAEEMGVITDGKATIEMRLEVVPYTQMLSMATLTRGNMFGWSALVEPHVFFASLRSTGNTQAILMKASDLQAVFRERPSVERIVMRNIATIMSTRLRDSWSQLTRLVAEMVKQGR